MGSQNRSGASSRVSSPQGHNLFQVCSPAPTWDSPLATDSSSTINLHGLQGDSLVFTRGCFGAPPLPPYLLVLVSAELFFSPGLTSLTGCCSAVFFFPLLKYVVTEVLPRLLMSSFLASSRSVLEALGIVSVGHGRSFWKLLTEATPIKPHYKNISTQI